MAGEDGSAGVCRSESLLLIAHWIVTAENEVSAYHRDVHETFGEQLARWVIKDWLQEVEGMEWPPSGDQVWKEITARSKGRLGIRLASQGSASTSREYGERP